MNICLPQCPEVKSVPIGDRRMREQAGRGGDHRQFYYVSKISAARDALKVHLTSAARRRAVYKEPETRNCAAYETCDMFRNMISDDHRHEYGLNGIP